MTHSEPDTESVGEAMGRACPWCGLVIAAHTHDDALGCLSALVRDGRVVPPLERLHQAGSSDDAAERTD